VNLVLIKGKIATDESKENDSTRPYVSTTSDIMLSAQNLRGGIIGTPATGGQTLPVPHEVAQSEVHDFYLPLVY
jgi:hypothetical protein